MRFMIIKNDNFSLPLFFFSIVFARTAIARWATRTKNVKPGWKMGDHSGAAIGQYFESDVVPPECALPFGICDLEKYEVGYAYKV